MFIQKLYLRIIYFKENYFKLSMSWKNRK